MLHQPLLGAKLRQKREKSLVGLSLNPIINGRVLEINSVRNVFPKNYHDWIHWINQGKMLRVDNKEEIQNIIYALRINPVDYIDDNALDSAAKLIKDFQNPNVGGKIIFRSVDNLREQYDKMVLTPTPRLIR